MNGKIYLYFNKRKFELEGIKKYYIGQTRFTLNERAGLNGIRYTKDNEPGKKVTSKFANAIRKWGWDSFEGEILEDNISSQEELNKLEMFYIEKYDSFNNGYNSTKGGDGVTGCTHTGMYGKEVTEEHRLKLSKSHIGKYKGKNHPMYGKNHTEEAKLKIKQARKRQKSSGMKGKHHSDETKDKLSRINKEIQNRSDIKEKNRQQALGNKRAKRSKVYCNELNLEFDCIADAIRYMKDNYNIDCSNISAVCRGTRNYSGILNDNKLTWKYV